MRNKNLLEQLKFTKIWIHLWAQKLNTVSIATIGFGLVILGFVLAIIAVILIVTRSTNSGTRSRGAGVLLIGPIPIIFGTDRESVKVLVLLAIILIAVVLVASIFLGR
jgi:uncharacterized protein (TIGR00304 family)